MRTHGDRSCKFLSGGAVGDPLEEVGHLGVERPGVGQPCESQPIESITAHVSDNPL